MKEENKKDFPVSNKEIVKKIKEINTASIYSISGADVIFLINDLQDQLSTLRKRLNDHIRNG